MDGDAAAVPPGRACHKETELSHGHSAVALLAQLERNTIDLSRYLLNYLKTLAITDKNVHFLCNF